MKIIEIVVTRAMFLLMPGEKTNPLVPFILKSIKLPMNHDDNKTMKTDKTKSFFSFSSIDVIYLHDWYFTFPLFLAILRFS